MAPKVEWGFYYKSRFSRDFEREQVVLIVPVRRSDTSPFILAATLLHVLAGDNLRRLRYQ
jgi:hypothetical protein